VLKAYDGRVRLVAKDLPLSIHSQARRAAEAARCAGAEGRYWPYRERLFAEQPRFAEERLTAYAVELGLDGPAFTRCLSERRFAADVEADPAHAELPYQRTHAGRRPSRGDLPHDHRRGLGEVGWRSSK
jgi:protein-disulfide isomerase